MKELIDKKAKKISKMKLSEKQSVRTTFKISKKANDIMETLVKAHNIKPKVIFEEMCSDEDLTELVLEAIRKVKNMVIALNELK